MGAKVERASVLTQQWPGLSLVTLKVWEDVITCPVAEIQAEDDTLASDCAVPTAKQKIASATKIKLAFILLDQKKTAVFISSGVSARDGSDDFC